MTPSRSSQSFSTDRSNARSTVRSTAPPSKMGWTTHAALVIALAIVVARMLTPDALRDPWEAQPGSQVSHASPGPGTGLVFDLIAALPALLILIRRAIDRGFSVSFHKSHGALFALIGLSMLSSIWSVDRFAALVNSTHFLAAGCLLWATSQLVRTPDRLRLVAALSMGLLLVLGIRTAIFRLVDLPQNITFWNENKALLLKERGMESDSFAARQMENKLVNGELLAFFNSANSAAAVAILLFSACAGIGLQKLRDGETKNWLLLLLVAAATLIWVLYNAKSKTSAATPLLGLAILGALAVSQSWLARYTHRKIFWSAVALVGLSLLAVIGHGLFHHGLFPGHFSNSLDFRWKYWVASTGIFLSHPLLGTGWSNFGFYYLAHRLPEAAEGIKDPHNWLVHFFVELGLLGGLLSMVWILRCAWEITRPSTAPENSVDAALTVKSAAAIVLLGILISVLANSDFSLPLLDELTLMLTPLLYLLALLLGTMSASMRSQHSWLLDDRPAPWVFYGCLIGLGLFLLHNLIDFSWFEPGPMFLFMMLLGSCLGMTDRSNNLNPSRKTSVTVLALAGAVWLCVALMLVLPVNVAELSAADANDQIRSASQSDSNQAGLHFEKAINALHTASRWIPYNVDYVYREAETRLRMGDLSGAYHLLADAKRINPRLIDSYLLDANIHLSQNDTDESAIRLDFSTILQIDPNSIPLRIQYAEALEKLGFLSEAAEQYRLAVAANDRLPAGEPTRLSVDKRSQLLEKSAMKT